MLLDCYTHVIDIEIDEDQHKRYDKECDDKRSMEILNDLRCPIVFIRFNPDTYVAKKGRVISPWKKRKSVV